ncbi:class A beta-lactamase-related serine hydrolase [Stigmatella sp. ncwal1]|uniref:Class A beta-lactamase-related serine hydrolase n=1 Tax=Stigmatella ashevillensis TaxID=2995309 RepID=A0ABT5DG74_9BACT|nr:serine hydrolase [Stigmatella ashevillena]MDC0712130.1 class A beta-lactamase-related serine hydrolase [Stigmatella ashevillena]
MLQTSLLLMLLAAPPGASSLQEILQQRISQVKGASVAVAYQDLGDSRDAVFLEADVSFHAASTMKVPVMVEFFRQVDAGGLALEQPIVLSNRFASIVDGSPYSLDAREDEDAALYEHLGKPVPASELLKRMIIRSSNLATNSLLALVDAKRVTRTLRALGAPSMTVLRGVEDGKAYAKGLNNTATARDLSTLLAALERGKAASPRSTQAMRGILLAQELNELIPAGLPPGTPVAHKTGQITAVLHDAAIVYPPGRAPYVLVVLTRGISDEQVARALIVDLSRHVHAHATRVLFQGPDAGQ